MELPGSQVVSTPLFEGLPNEAAAALERAAHARSWQRGDVLYLEGGPADAFFVIRSGSVKLTQLSAEGHQVVLRLVGPKDPIGAAAALGEDVYPVTAEAVTAVDAFVWTGRQIAGLMEQHPRLALNFVRFMAARLHSLQVQFRHLATERVERRVARALLRVEQHAGRQVEGGVLLDLPLSREDVAQMAGTSLYAVSRIVSRWEAAGILEAGRQRLVILRRLALVAVAEELTEPAP